MKNVLIWILIIVVLGYGGYYFYTKNASQTSDSMQKDDTSMEGQNSMMDDESMEYSGTTTENGNDAMMKEGDTMMKDTGESAPPAENSVKTFTIEGSPFKFVPNVIRVNEGDTVKVVFKNISGTHDFVLDEFNVRTPRTSTGEEATVEFVADKKGSFEYYCSVDSHRQKGMWGTLIVE